MKLSATVDIIAYCGAVALIGAGVARHDAGAALASVGSILLVTLFASRIRVKGAGK